MAESSKLKVLVVDGKDTFSVVKLLNDNGVDCDIVTVEELRAIQQEKFPNLEEMIDSKLNQINQLKSMQPNNSCWWQQFYVKGKKHPDFFQ